MRFTADTAAARAEIAKLRAEMKAMQMANNAYNAASTKAMSRGLAGGPASMAFNLRGPLQQMDELTKRIQKGKISQKEFHDTIRGTNKLYEYQNALQKSSLNNIRQMGTGRFNTGLNVGELQKANNLLQGTATQWATAGAAAKAYGRQVMDVGKNMAFMGRQAMLSITAPLALMAGGAAMLFYKVDQQLTNLAKVYGDTADGMKASNEDIRASARGLAQELNRMYGTSEEDTLSLATAFAALGETGKDLDYMTDAAARLMRLGDVSVDSATKLVSTLRTVFKLEGQELQDAINMANTFENSTTLTMQDFADALPKMGSIVQSWGGNIKDAAVILEGFTRAGIPAVEGANALKSGFTKLVRPTEKLEKKFSDLTGGMSLTGIVKELNGDVPKIIAKIGEIQKSQNWDDYTKKNFSAELWGAYQLNRGMALTESLGNPTEQIAKLQAMTDKELEEYNKATADREVAIQMQSASAQFKVALNNAKMFAEQIGEAILPHITAALNGIINFVKWSVNGLRQVRDALGPIGTLLQSVGKYALIAAAAFGPMMLMLSSLFLIRGGLITVMGIIASSMAKLRGQKGVTLFQSGSQRAAELQAKQMAATQQAQLTATNRLRGAIDGLSASYTKMASSSQIAGSASTRTAEAQASAAARATSATNTQTAAVLRLNAAQLQAARMGGHVLLNNPIARKAQQQAVVGSTPNSKSGNYQTTHAPLLGPQRPTPAPSMWAGIQSARANNAPISAAQQQVNAYTKAFTQQAAKTQSARQQALMQSFVSPGKNSTIAGQANEAARRQAAGIGIASQRDANSNRVMASSQAATISSARDGSSSYATRARDAEVANRRSAALAEQASRATMNRAHAEALVMNRARDTNALVTSQAQKYGGIVMGLGMMGSLIGTNNQKLQMGLNILMAVGTLAMMWPGLFGAIGAKISTLLVGSVGGAMGKITLMARGIGAALSAAFWPLMIVAGIGAIAYGAYKMATKGARELKEQNDAIKKSTEGWSEVLGYTRTQFGQIKNAAGEVVDTQASLVKEAMANETLGPLIDRLHEDGDDIQALTATLEREAVKLYADGANPAQVKQAIETMLDAANIDPTIENELKIRFANVTPTGLNGENLSDTVQQQLSGLFNTSQDNTVSYWQQQGFGTGFMGTGFGPGGEQKDAEELSQKAKTEIDNIYNQMNNAIANAKPEQKANLMKNWIAGVQKSVDDALNTLPKEVNDKIKEKGGILNIDAESMGEEFGLSDEQVSTLKYQQNVLSEFMSRLSQDNQMAGIPDMFKNTGDAVVQMAASTKTAIFSYEQGSDAFATKAHMMGAEFDKMDNHAKVALMNVYRLASGLAPLSDEEGRLAMEAQNFGNRTAAAGVSIDGAAAAAEDGTEAIADLNEEFGTGKTADWTALVTIETAAGDHQMSVDDLVNQRKDVMKGVVDDYMDEMQAEAQIQWDAQKRAFQDQQKAAADALKERQDAEKNALSAAQEGEKKAFDSGWDARMENEKKGFADRIKAIEDTQEAEDDLERTRKRNSEREQRRLKYTQSLMQTGIDTNIAMAGGDLDEVARLSLNAATAATDYSTETTDAEAGYAKEDADRGRAKAIDKIKEEEEARMASLEKQKAAEQEAMDARLEMQRQELERKQQAETAYLQRKQEDENIAYEISFQANQRALNRELEALRTQIPLNEAELQAHMARVGGAYDQHGVNLMQKGDVWSKTIEDGLIRHIDTAREVMSNEQNWLNFGNRVAEGVSKGAFNMNGAQFNDFLRTGNMPGGPQGGGPQPFIGPVAPGRTRHGGGALKGVDTNDPLNNRGGIPMSAPMRRDEVSLLAKRDEYVIRGKAHKKYGTAIMNRVNQGTAIIRHEGGQVGDTVTRHDGGMVDEKAVRHEGGNLGALTGAIQASMMGGLISRAGLAMGNAMMTAVQSGMSSGGFIGEGAAKAAQDFARGETGKPYQYAGVGDPSWDCSGFMGAIWAILTGKDPRKRWMSTETFNGAPDGTMGMKKGIAPDFPNGFTMGFMHGGGGPNSHTAGTLLGQNVEAGGNGVGMGPQYAGALDPQFTEHWYLPGVSGKAPTPAAAPGSGLEGKNYIGWSTPGIEAYGRAAMAQFGMSSADAAAMGEFLSGNSDLYAKEIIEEAKRRNISKKGATIAVMTAMQESSLRMLANHAVPESFNFPHDGVGGDHDSIGLFQQRQAGWGTVAQRMNPRASAGMFYNKLVQFDYNNMEEGAAAQKVQVSATPTAYSKWKGQASGFANKYFDFGGLADGLGFMQKATLKPERVLSPQQTKAFEDLIPMLDGRLANMGIVGYDDIVNRLATDAHSLVNAAADTAKAAYNSMSSEEKYEFNIHLDNANINGVDDLDRRFKEWGNEIVERVRQEAINKQRRLGNR